MSLIVDSHAHVFPQSVTKLLHTATSGFLKEKHQERFSIVRQIGRSLIEPFTQSLHSAQTFLRILPAPLRRWVDEIGSLATLPGFLFESDVSDLKQAMESSGVKYALIIAHPPIATNDFILDLAREDSGLIPVVNVTDPALKTQHIETFVKKGAKAFKLHLPAYGQSANAKYLKKVLEVAASTQLPVILHTGCFHMKLFYKNPELGEVDQFKDWFERFPNISFILAHMNYHQPQKAMELAENYPQLYLDTSWQPTETIAEAVRRVGSERILFGSDWPLVGRNIEIGIRRIEDALVSGLIRQEDYDRILGHNALKLFKLETARSTRTSTTHKGKSEKHAI